MHMKVQNVMTTDVASVEQDTPFKDIAELLIAREVSAVPVVDAGRRVVGVVSEADLLRKEEFRDQFYREGYRPPLRARLRDRLAGHAGHAEARGEVAADLMSTPAHTVGPGTTVVTAARLMDEHGVKRLPVTDDEGGLVGIVSRRDLLKVFVRGDEDISREVRDDVLTHSLWIETSDVKVATCRGVVTLSGHLRLRSEARLAARMVRRVNGVVDVVDEIGYDEDDTPRWQAS
ncbi:CBS domain-containing protein [Sphaerisporangium sp. TRM90804]|uniref:CBS domain-containing protein n=1 Tax=Sphaerisporangium sp. TRM90804 TaxID=3031113 RepID=UPI0024493B7F|nr:CBS domain-containing protein [Sphaerisporangium sp. TRM90804]MDH2430829.1 CBS domain-containing protein [Sphaerisporangium sp. TRM90804]